MRRIILFPYAGSLGLAYNKWKRVLEQNFEVLIIDYNRLKGSYYEPKSWDELVELTVKKVESFITDSNYIFFGHSMGSRMAQSVYYELEKKNGPLPSKVILSGCKTLDQAVKNPDFATEEEFRDEYIRLGGISEEVLANKELADLSFADLKKDIRILSQFRYEDYDKKMECPVIILNGTKDNISTKEEWEQLLEKEEDYRMYEGKHFFIYDKEPELLEFLSKQ